VQFLGPSSAEDILADWNPFPHWGETTSTIPGTSIDCFQWLPEGTFKAAIEGEIYTPYLLAGRLELKAGSKISGPDGSYIFIEWHSVRWPEYKLIYKGEASEIQLSKQFGYRKYWILDFERTAGIRDDRALIRAWRKDGKRIDDADRNGKPVQVLGPSLGPRRPSFSIVSEDANRVSYLTDLDPTKTGTLSIRSYHRQQVVFRNLPIYPKGK